MSRLGLLVILMMGRAVGFDPTTKDEHARTKCFAAAGAVTDIQYINT
jgi:hypothetical protein